MAKRTQIERFWAKVDRDGPIPEHRAELGPCWPWTATLQRGYGIFYDVGNHSVRAHRFSWELHYGEIPDDLCVCHSCDNPRCVRPTHLFLGTSIVNNADRDAKGRHAKGRYGTNLANSVKTHCPKGHPYSGDNLHIGPRGNRQCRQCQRERVRAKYWTRQGLEPPPLEPKTHCPAGHPYDGDNLYIAPNGTRGCKACRNAHSREHKRRKRRG